MSSSMSMSSRVLYDSNNNNNINNINNIVQQKKTTHIRIDVSRLLGHEENGLLDITLPLDYEVCTIDGGKRQVWSHLLSSLDFVLERTDR